MIHECLLDMKMDSNSLGNLLDVMMMSRSNSSSSGCENDGIAAAVEKKRRFSKAQVKSLEVMFEAQTKLEQRKKQQLAKELGLQPRQVAIWFQNKRARWKSKQLERAYAALSTDYDALRSSFDSLFLQKNDLSIQVERLVKLLGSNPEEEKERGKHSDDDTDEKKVNPSSGGKEVEQHTQKLTKVLN